MTQSGHCRAGTALPFENVTSCGSGEARRCQKQIKAPTPYVWIIGRTKTDGLADYDAVHKIRPATKFTPLSQGKESAPQVVKIDPAIDMKTPPKVTVDTMKAGPYFARAAELLKLHPPHITDQLIIARLKRIGFDVGAPVDLGANLREDAIFNLADSKGNPLDGANTYTIHFDKGDTPPAEAFWSITLYDPAGFQVANSINRFAVSSWMPFKYNPDGSLDLYFQNESPGADKKANWLPAPRGPYNLTMRVYAPKSDAPTGKWDPSPVVKVQTAPVAAQ